MSCDPNSSLVCLGLSVGAGGLLGALIAFVVLSLIFM